MKDFFASLCLLMATASFAQDAAYSKVRILAHRGVAQAYDRAGLTMQTCTASRMLPPTHGFLENTIESMRAAFEHGADRVEFDIHPTTDGEFVVFHDWTVDCRTEGKGVTREQSLAYLKSLDVGYGYTADGGATFPFRGKFKGAMPTWAEVMAAFPGGRFLVNFKSRSAAEGKAAVAYARARGYDERQLAFSGADPPIEAVREEWPQVRTLGRGRLESCLLTYLFTGWTGHVPEACANAILYVPINYASLLWGWPSDFVKRMAAVGSEVYLAGPFTPGAMGMKGLDSLDEIKSLPPDYEGGVITDRIEIVGPALGKPR